MKRLMLAAMMATMGWGTQAAQAQPLGTYSPPATSPFYRPAVDPILNTLGPRGSGLSGGIGYYTQTLP